MAVVCVVLALTGRGTSKPVPPLPVATLAPVAAAAPDDPAPAPVAPAMPVATVAPDDPAPALVAPAVPAVPELSDQPASAKAAVAPKRATPKVRKKPAGRGGRLAASSRATSKLRSR